MFDPNNTQVAQNGNQGQGTYALQQASTQPASLISPYTFQNKTPYTINDIKELMQAAARLGIESFRVGDMEFSFYKGGQASQPVVITEQKPLKQELSDEDMLYYSSAVASN
jgi:hypothetical protein